MEEKTEYTFANVCLPSIHNSVYISEYNIYQIVMYMFYASFGNYVRRGCDEKKVLSARILIAKTLG